MLFSQTFQINHSLQRSYMFVGRIFIMNQYFKVTTPRYTVFHHFHMKFVNFASITSCEFDIVSVRRNSEMSPGHFVLHTTTFSHTY